MSNFTKFKQQQVCDKMTDNVEIYIYAGKK